MIEIVRAPILRTVRLRRFPQEWALLFGIGFAIGIAAGSIIG